MMGLGSLGNGGSSSSSSNLSALAPPFTVDRSNPKPNSNPLMYFSEPPYAVPFQSSFHDWQYSHSSASRPDLYSNLDSEVDSIRTTYLPSANDYGHLGSHTVNSPSTHMPPLNPNVSAATDTFTFLQCSSDIPSNHVEANSYYPQFVSPGVDDDVPLVPLNEHSCDLLSTSRVAPLDGPSQVGYPQSLSGLEYMPQWGSFWNRLADEEKGKWVELDRGVCTEEINNAGSYVYKNYMKQGAGTAEGLSKCEEASAVSPRKCVDIFNQFVSSSTGKLNDKSSSLQDPRFIFSEFSRPSISGMSSTLLESHPPVPSLESATNPYSASYDKCFQLFDSCLDDHISVKKSSPAIVIRPPCIGTSTTLPNTVSSDVNCIGNVAAINNKDFGCHNPSNQKEPLLPRSYGKEGCLDSSQTSLHMERSVPVVLAASFTGEEELSSKPATTEGLDHMSKTGMEFQLPDINMPDGFTLAHDTAKGFTSVEDYLESLDHYNPAVDSPCWKGARASRFSPSEVSEAVTPQHFMKKLEACNSLYPQQTQIFPPCTDVNVKVSCQNLCENSVYQENGYVELGSLLCPERLSNANCPDREHISTDAVKAGFDYLKPSSSNGVQFSHEFDKPREDYDVPNDSKSDSDLKPHTKQPGLDKGDFRSERVIKLCSDVVDTGLNANDATEDGSVTFHGVESTSCLPCSAEDVNKPAKLHATESTPNMNVGMLVKTLHNLSELLLFHCSNDASAVSEEDHEALKHVINNLDECVSRKIVPMTRTRESMFTQEGASHECKNLPDFHEGVIAGKPQVTKEAGSSSHGWFDHHCMQEGKGSGNVFAKEVEKFPDFVSLRGYADSVRDDNLVQAIKEILKEAFNGEEEIQSETLLYKNLWLEAEAALCSISYRARVDRMKIEMEKFKLHKGKDVAEGAMAVEKLLNSKVSPDPGITNKVTLEVKNSPMPDNSVQDSPISSITKVVDDVEASVLARFHILQCRGENSSSASTEGQQPAEVVDTGFAGKTNHWPFIGYQSEDGNLDVAVGPYSHCPMLDNSIQDLPSSSITKVVDDVEAFALARFHNLKCRGENSSSASTEGQRLAEVVDTGFAGKTNHCLFIGDQSADGSLDVAVGPYSHCPMPDNSIRDSPISSITKVGNDVEASALARFHILKCRGENSNSVSTEGQQQAEVVDTGFAVKTNHWPFIGDQSADGSLDVAVGLYSQYCSGNSKVDNFGSYVGGSESDHQTMKDLSVCGTDDQAIQSWKNKKLGSQLPSGWCDISSSDWEHVMKDEFASQN